MTYTPGAVIEIGYPFVRDVRSDADGPGEPTWRPGTRDRQSAPDDFEMVADGVGTMILTIISTHKPGRYPTRVFYELRWRDPDGREFGKSDVLRVAAASHFTALTKGYRHRYRLAEGEAIEGATHRITSRDLLDARMG